MRKQKLIVTLLVVTALAVGAYTGILLTLVPADTAPSSFTYKVVKVYPHDPNAFTQGLVIEHGVLYESTGLWGYSTLRQVDLETGTVQQMHSLSADFFGEGITIFNGKIIQLTWQNQVGFVYDKQTFALIRNFSYSTEGWGITHDGKRLIMSDGTANLYFLDPETFQKIGQVEVHDGNVSVPRLNELEFVKGDVYANVWGEDRIAIINPETGQVKGWIDLACIYPQANQNPNSVLNGIAYDQEADRLFVTGKLWSKLFEIKLIERK